MDCNTDTLTLESVLLQKGYWRFGSASPDVRPCSFKRVSCPGGATKATGLNPYCSANHVGHLCSACAPDFFLSWTGDGECYQCATGKSHAPTIGLVAGVFMFVAACLACVYKKGKKKAKARAGAPKSTYLTNLNFKAEKVYSLAKFKVFTLFLTSQVGTLSRL
jgi:hypothetical protein